MNIYEYIDKYGEYSFIEKEFNEVDNVIFSLIIYLNFGRIKNKYSLEEISKKYFNKKDDKRKYSKIKKVLDKVSNTKRYKDVLVYNYVNISNKQEMFSAISLEYLPGYVYISFKGTDQSLGAWRDNLDLWCMYPVKCQEYAKKYVNKYTFGMKKIILGGHSKGGNIAMSAFLDCNFIMKNKIIKVYNNDGPGFRFKEFNSNNYDKLMDKLIYIIPNYSIVGLMLRHMDNYKVIMSNRKRIYAHSPMTWLVEDDHFLKGKLSEFSKVADKTFKQWLDSYDDDIRKEFVDGLLKVFIKCDITKLSDFVDNKKKILVALKEIRHIDKDVKKMIIQFIDYIFISFNEIEWKKEKN